MKKTLIFIAFLALMLGTFTGLSATVTWTVPGTYATLSAAVTALNGVGALADSYVINVAPGYTETLTTRINLTATGTASYSITIQKASAGTNPLLTAFVGAGTPTSPTPDGMFSLQGSDYVTIDGIDLYDPNASSPGFMEYGYGLFKNTVTDGAQYNTIKNCTVTLNRMNFATGSGPMVEGSVCITVPNSIPTAAATALTPTSAAGTNSYNKFYTNTLQNANYGIVFNGYAASTPFTLGDTGNDVGGVAVSTGNTIINYGGGTASANPSAAIRGNNQWGWNASYNTINNNNGSGVNHPSTLRGIYAQAGVSASCNINYNNITIKSGAASSQADGIECFIGATAAGNTVNVNNNTVTGSYTTATSGTYYGIYCSTSATTLNMNNNVVSNITLPGTGTLYGLYAASTPVNLNSNYNQVYNLSKTGASGPLRGVSYPTALLTFTYNEIHDLTMPSTSGSTAPTIYGYYNFGSPLYENLSNNQVYNLSIGGTNTNASTIIWGIYTNTTGLAVKTVNNNTIYGLQYNATGTATVYGISQALGTPAEVGRNKIYNLSTTSATSIVSGIIITSGTTNNVHNNMIYGISAPGSTTAATSPAVRGISITGGTTNNIHYNSIYLNYAGANAYYATAGLYLSAGTTNEIRNNIVVNKCTPGASGRSVAIWKTAIGTTYIGANTNKNIYYYLPGVMAYNGTTTYSTLGDWKTAMAGPDGGSYEEDAPFLLSPDLHINPSVSTRVEGNAVAITALCDVDFDGANRSDSTPDIGADEGDFTPVLAPPGVPVYSTPANNATDIAINAPLVWSANAEGGTPTNYDVSIGTSDPPDFYANVPASPSNPAKEWGKTYYWKIKAYNSEGESEGPVWKFDTASGVPALTYPGSGATGIPGMFTFTWGAVAGAGSYKISVGTTPGGTNVQNMTACATNGYIQAVALAYNTPYYWSVYAVNGEQEVQSAEWTFTTMLDPTVYTFPFTESFDGTTFPPTNWLNVKVAGTGTPGTWDRVTTGTNPPCNTHSGAGMARYYAYNYAVGTNGILVSPPISFGADVYKVTFWMYRDATYPDAQYEPEGVKVFYAPVPNLTGATELLYIHRAINYAPVVGAIGWYEYSVNLPTAKDRGIGYLIYEGLSAYGNNLFIDDSVVSIVPAAPTLTVTPASLAYGQATQSHPTPWQNVTLTNTGGGTITINAGDISLIGTDPSQFEFSTANLIPMGTGISCTIPVRMIATSEGAKSATLRVSWGAKAYYDVTLTGEGLPAGVVLVGNGTADLSLPIEPYYGYTYSQSIFLQSELAMADKRIEKLYYYWNGLAAAVNSNNWVVYMGHTPLTAFADGTSWIPLANLTQVFAGEVALPATAGWIEIPLQNYFIYNNVDNLVICVDENEALYDSSSHFFFCTASATNRSIRYYNDTTNPDPSTPPTGTAVLGYPDVKLQFGDIPQIPAFQITPASKNYGNAYIGYPVPQTFTITNTGGGTLDILSSDISIAGNDPDQFVLTPVTANISLAAGFSTQITVTFNPTSLGAKSANIKIIDNVAKNTENIALSGNGQAPPGWAVVEGFENGNSLWTVVNGTQTNQWVTGTATNNGGTHAMYISNDSGATNNYNVDATSVVHFYRDVAFPAVKGDLSLKFDWMGQGEGGTTNYDYLQVFLVDQTVTPVAGTQLTTGQIGANYYLLQGTWQNVIIDLSDALAGSVKRLVFSWRNDSSLGAQPPAAVDNIGIYEGEGLLPVELSSFTAVLSAENYVNLTWVTQSETGVQGYYVYRSSTTDLVNALVVSPMIDATNTSDQHSYEFTDSELNEDGTYYYWLQNVDFSGNMSFHGPVSVYYSTTGTDPVPEIPLFTELKSVYPNPFNPTAFIPYSIANTADVNIRIYNSRGQLLRNFALGNKLPGNYRITWDGKDSNGGNCGNGIYYIIMNAGRDSFQRKAVLLK